MIDLAPINLSEVNLKTLVHLHKASYPSYLLTSKFNERMLGLFYKNLLEYSPKSYLIRVNGVDAGIIIGSTQASQARQKFIKSNMMSLIATLILNPQFIVKKLLSLSFFNSGFETKYNFRLVNLLIDRQQLENLGLTKQENRSVTLNAVSLWENMLRADGIFSYGHSIDRRNLKAINFYLKNGCRIEHITKGSVSMFKKLN